MLHQLTFVLIFATQVVLAQDYRHYHNLVNYAERSFFINGDADSAFNYYDSAFAQFDFVFVKDCYMAAQIAVHTKDSKYLSYLRKGFANGLQPWHLKLAPVFASLMKDSLGLMRKIKDYPALRKQYLARIKVPVLRRVIQIATKDQTEKRYPTAQYLPILIENMRYVEALIKSVGFPGDKTIGISQMDIMKELGYKKQDITDYAWGATFSDADSTLSQDYMVPLLLHRICTYVLFRGYWEMLISKGEIHPRDVAFLHDWMMPRNDDTWARQKIRIQAYECPTEFPIYGCYRTTVPFSPARSLCDRRVTDSMRARLFINTMAVDSAKIAIGEKSGFKTTFGFIGCR